MKSILKKLWHGNFTSISFLIVFTIFIILFSVRVVDAIETIVNTIDTILILLYHPLFSLSI